MLKQKLLYFYYMGQDEKILAAKQIIDDSSKITVLTGAGISAESGIPTFRDKEGMWNNINPQDIASPRATAVPTSSGSRDRIRMETGSTAA